jgi:hypothetical protein
MASRRRATCPASSWASAAWAMSFSTARMSGKPRASMCAPSVWDLGLRGESGWRRGGSVPALQPATPLVGVFRHSDGAAQDSAPDDRSFFFRCSLAHVYFSLHHISSLWPGALCFLSTHIRIQTRVPTTSPAYTATSNCRPRGRGRSSAPRPRD